MSAPWWSLVALWAIAVYTGWNVRDIVDNVRKLKQMKAEKARIAATAKRNASAVDAELLYLLGPGGDFPRRDSKRGEA